MTDSWISHAIVRLFTHLIVDLPFYLVMARIAISVEFFDRFNLPTPTWRQAVGVVLIAWMVT